jgi:hypothetical protein
MRDQIDDDRVPRAGYQQVDERRNPLAADEGRPVVAADQPTASLQVEAGPGPQRHYADPATSGYWIVKSNGGVDAFAAPSHGSLAGHVPAARSVTRIAGE